MSEATLEKEKESEVITARLLKERMVLAFGKIDEKLAANVVASLLYLAAGDAKLPITLYINSDGGNDADILGIYDVMRGLSCPVETVCVGKAHGVTALLLAGGARGKRKAYANSEVMLSQVGRGRTFGQASDIELETEHLLETKRRITALIAALCGKEEEQVRADLERKYWLYAEKAREYGLVDQVIE